MVNHIIPSSLQEALNFLATNQYQVIAGGTDLMVANRSWAETPVAFKKSMLYIANLQELNYIRSDDTSLYIGATTPLEVMLHHNEVPHLLREVIGEMASPAIRNVATLAGNIGNASPAGDTLVVLYVLDASVKLVSKTDCKIIKVKDLIIGPKQTKIESSYMISEIIIPKHEFTYTKFVKVGGRVADAISKVSFAGAATIKNQIIKDIRIAFGAVAKTVVRDETIEQQLIGKHVDQVILDMKTIVDAYSVQITPIDDQRSNKTYRKQVAIQILTSFLQSLK